MDLNIIKDLPIFSSKGHSRLVYDYGDKVIKVAKTKTGFISNFKEKFLYDFFSKFYNNKIFPTVYEISEDSKYIIVDKCEYITPEEFDKLYPYLIWSKSTEDLNESELNFVTSFTEVKLSGINIDVEKYYNMGKLNGEYKILDAGQWLEHQPRAKIN